MADELDDNSLFAKSQKYLSNMLKNSIMWPLDHNRNVVTLPIPKLLQDALFCALDLQSHTIEHVYEITRNNLLTFIPHFSELAQRANSTFDCQTQCKRWSVTWSTEVIDLHLLLCDHNTGVRLMIPNPDYFTEHSSFTIIIDSDISMSVLYEVLLSIGIDPAIMDTFLCSTVDIYFTCTMLFKETCHNVSFRTSRPWELRPQLSFSDFVEFIIKNIYTDCENFHLMEITL